MLKDELVAVEVEKTELAKGKAEVEERGKTLATEVVKCHAFRLRISEDCFHQCLR